MPPENHNLNEKDKKQIAEYILNFVNESDKPHAQECIDFQNEESCSKLPF